MILKNENDFEKLKWIWKTKMISKNENEFEKWKWTWKMKMNLNIHTISGVRYDTTLLYPQLSPDAIATPRQPTSHWWLCRWFQPARPSAILSALAGRCWPPLPPQRQPLKSLSTAGRVLPYTKIDYTIQREKFHVPIRLLLFEAGHEKKSFSVETDMGNMTIWILFFGLHRHVRCLHDGRKDRRCANFWCSIRRCSWDRAILPMNSSLEWPNFI